VIWNFGEFRGHAHINPTRGTGIGPRPNSARGHLEFREFRGHGLSQSAAPQAFEIADCRLQIVAGVARELQATNLKPTASTSPNSLPLTANG